MKKCFKCNIEKPIDFFYKHKAMKDGRLNKCIECTKIDVKKRSVELMKDPIEIEKERSRSKEKYHRLGYREKQKEWDKDKKWKNSSACKNLNRDLKIQKGYEAHHWNYDDIFLKDVFIMETKEHRQLHKLLILDIEKKIFKTKQDGKYLFSKLDHVFFIVQNGFKFKSIKV